MTTSTAPRTGSYLFHTPDTRRRTQRADVLVIATPQYLRPAPGMFVIQFPNTGYMQFARMTGRTFYRHGYNCPTVERFEIDTVADEDGSLWGDPGVKVNGTVAAYPSQMTA